MGPGASGVGGEDLVYFSFRMVWAVLDTSNLRATYTTKSRCGTKDLRFFLSRLARFQSPMQHQGWPLGVAARNKRRGHYIFFETNTMGYWVSDQIAEREDKCNARYSNCSTTSKMPCVQIKPHV